MKRGYIAIAVWAVCWWCFLMQAGGGWNTNVWPTADHPRAYSNNVEWPPDSGTNRAFWNPQWWAYDSWIMVTNRANLLGVSSNAFGGPENRPMYYIYEWSNLVWTKSALSSLLAGTNDAYFVDPDEVSGGDLDAYFATPWGADDMQDHVDNDVQFDGDLWVWDSYVGSWIERGVRYHAAPPRLTERLACEQSGLPYEMQTNVTAVTNHTVPGWFAGPQQLGQETVTQSNTVLSVTSIVHVKTWFDYTPRVLKYGMGPSVTNASTADGYTAADYGWHGAYNLSSNLVFVAYTNTYATSATYRARGRTYDSNFLAEYVQVYDDLAGTNVGSAFWVTNSASTGSDFVPPSDAGDGETFTGAVDAVFTWQSDTNLTGIKWGFFPVTTNEPIYDYAYQHYRGTNTGSATPLSQLGESTLHSPTGEFHSAYLIEERFDYTDETMDFADASQFRKSDYRLFATNLPYGYFGTCVWYVAVNNSASDDNISNSWTRAAGTTNEYFRIPTNGTPVEEEYDVDTFTNATHDYANEWTGTVTFTADAAFESSAASTKGVEDQDVLIFNPIYPGASGNLFYLEPVGTNLTAKYYHYYDENADGATTGAEDYVYHEYDTREASNGMARTLSMEIDSHFLVIQYDMYD